VRGLLLLLLLCRGVWRVVCESDAATRAQPATTARRRVARRLFGGKPVTQGDEVVIGDTVMMIGDATREPALCLCLGKERAQAWAATPSHCDAAAWSRSMQ